MDLSQFASTPSLVNFAMTDMAAGMASGMAPPVTGSGTTKRNPKTSTVEKKSKAQIPSTKIPKTDASRQTGSATTKQNPKTSTVEKKSKAQITSTKISKTDAPRSTGSKLDVPARFPNGSCRATGVWHCSFPKTTIRSFDDMPKASFVKTRLDLICPKQHTRDNHCIFGLYNFYAPAPGGVVQFTLADAFAGGIHDLTYKGVPFVLPVQINGAALQSDVFLEANPKKNPTEDGSEDDSFTGTSSSVLLDFRANATNVFTKVKAAYFSRPSPNAVVSDVIIAKRLRAVAEGIVDYTVWFDLPKVNNVLVEVLAGWVPWASAAQNLVYSNGTWGDAATVMASAYKNYVRPPGGLAFGVSDGSAAMGVIPMIWPDRGVMLMRSGLDVQEQNDWKKWNMVHPLTGSTDLPAGTYGWIFRLVFGTMPQVKAMVERFSRSRW